MLFGWLVEAGVTSNSVIYVKDRVTVGIGTGEQDRVGVAEIARDKAYRKFPTGTVSKPATKPEPPWSSRGREASNTDKYGLRPTAIGGFSALNL